MVDKKYNLELCTVAQVPVFFPYRVVDGVRRLS
jgi:hypothetical protein